MENFKIQRTLGIKMKCSLCNKKALVEYGFSIPVCKEHFLKVLSSRVKKNLRKNMAFETKGIFLFLDDSTHDSETLLKIILPIVKIENRAYEIKRIRSRYEFKIKKEYKKPLKILLPWTANDSAAIFIKKIIEGKNPNIKINNSNFKIIKPLECMLDSESFLFYVFSNKDSCEYKKILKILKKKNILGNNELKEIVDDLVLKEKKPNKEIRFFLNNVEKFHPGTIFSIVSYIRKMNNFPDY